MWCRNICDQHRRRMAKTTSADTGASSISRVLRGSADIKCGVWSCEKAGVGGTRRWLSLIDQASGVGQGLLLGVFFL